MHLAFPLWLALATAAPPLPPPDPPLSDLEWLPPARLVDAMCEGGRTYRAVAQANLDHSGTAREREYWRSAVVDADACLAPWVALQSARDPEAWAWDEAGWVCAGPGEGAQRWHLARLRRLVGCRAYYAARLPPPVPIWRFRLAD